MNVDISPEHREFVRDELENGHFSTEQELFDEAIELLRARQSLLSKIDEGLDQLARGDAVEYGIDDRKRFIADILGKPFLNGPQS